MTNSEAYRDHDTDNATQILASASYDDTIKLYVDDPSDDWYCFATLSGHTSTVWSIAWAPNGRYLSSASDDRTIRIWRRTGDGLGKWHCVLVIDGHERSIYSLSWGIGIPRSGKSGHLGWLASTGGDGKINVWELHVRFRFFISFQKQIDSCRLALDLNVESGLTSFLHSTGRRCLRGCAFVRR
jgi:WD40 repeat protein